MEQKIKVAVQGFEGCFHQEAAYALLGKEIELVGCASFRELVKSVESGKSDKGVMAIENSIAGSILPNFALIQSYNLKITAEIHMRIRQNLLAIKGTKIEDIKEVQSHPIALLQCAKFFENNLTSDIRLVETRDTAYSASRVAELGSCEVAAVASKFASELYGLEVIAEDIHSEPNNFTRFIVVEREDKVKPVIGSNKASLYFKVAHEKGSLANVLKCFDSLNVNMTKLQSYPIPSDPFRYIFHTDMEFDHLEEFLVAVDTAKLQLEDLRIYGIYKTGQFI